MKLTWSRLPLELATPFRTATAYRTVQDNVLIRIESEGLVGWGEAAPTETYRQTVDSVEAALTGMAPLLQSGPTAIESITRMLLERFPHDLAAVSAVDAALHDWVGKRHGLPTVAGLGLDASGGPATSYTLGIDDPDRIAERVRAASTFPILKLKLDREHGVATVALVRRLAPEKTIRVDANTAWSVDEALDLLPELAALGVEYVEQPVQRDDIDGLRRLKEAAILPIVADESSIRPADIIALAGAVDGVNIKLSKCGGIREALKMIHIARALDMRVMLGCMVESSLGIAAAAQLAALADWLDLDGHLLIQRDPFTGLGGAAGQLTIGRGPGLGVTPVEPVAGPCPVAD